MSHFHPDESQRRAFQDDGFVIVRQLLSQDEVSLARNYIEVSQEIVDHSFGRVDIEGRTSRMSMWSYAGDDILGLISRSRKVAGTMEYLMGGDEIYHYHSKLMMKEAKTGGSFMWHQDYGYWYYNGCMLPEMGSVFIPIDKCIKANGCLQVLRGSHRLGRLDHILKADQATVDPERLEHAKSMFPLVHVEMEPGDVLFFDCNLLHTSAGNYSDLRRYVMITSYNKRKNNPTRPHHCPQYHPLDMVEDDVIKTFDPQKATQVKEFTDPNAKTNFQSLQKAKTEEGRKV